MCRVYTLQRIMDAAFDNLNRIRLIWGRLWAALAAHLVAAACHADPKVSVLAVGHMRALVQRLLARSELSCFTHQVKPHTSTSVLLHHVQCFWPHAHAPIAPACANKQVAWGGHLLRSSINIIGRLRHKQSICD